MKKTSAGGLVNYFRKKDKTFYLLLLIIALAAFLRFYNFPYRYSLGEETVRDAVIGIQAAREWQLPLTGAFSSLGPFTFGPWYSYQLALVTLIFPNNYAPWIYLGIISILYVFIMYKIGKLLFGSWFGIILAFLATVSPAQIITGTHLTSHNTTNLFAVLAIWIFLLLAKKKISYWFGFLLGFVIGIGMNLHFQMGGLLIFPLILLFYRLKQYLYFIAATGGVIVSFLPMIFFELNNHWFNTRNIVDFLLYGKDAISVPNRWLTYLGEFWPAFFADALGVPIWFAYAMILLPTVYFFLLIKNKKLSPPIILLMIGFLVNFVMLRYYFGPKFFGYLNFLRPFVFLYAAFAIYSISQRRYFYLPGILIAVCILFFSFPRNFATLAKDPYSMLIYDRVESLEKKFPKDSFSVYRCVRKFSIRHNADVYSTVFLLDHKNKLSKRGKKVVLATSDCEYPMRREFDTISTENMSMQQQDVFLLSVAGITDVSYATEGALLESGWEKSTFPSIYNEYARWWFRLQP